MTPAMLTRTAHAFKAITRAAVKAGWSLQGSDTHHLYLTRTTTDGRPVDLIISATATPHRFDLQVKAGTAHAITRMTARDISATLTRTRKATNAHA